MGGSRGGQVGGFLVGFEEIQENDSNKESRLWLGGKLLNWTQDIVGAVRTLLASQAVLVLLLEIFTFFSQ